MNNKFKIYRAIITVVSVIMVLHINSTLSKSSSELDNVEVLTINQDGLQGSEYLRNKELKKELLGNIQLNKGLTIKEYEKDIRNFLSFYLDEQAYFGNSTREQIEKEAEKLLEKPENKTVSDLNLDISKIIAHTNDGHTSTLLGIGENFLPIKIKIINGDYYIINTTKEYEKLLYSKVTKIGNTTTEKITKKLRNYISAENNYFKTHIIEDNLLLYSDILLRENIIKDNKIRLTLEINNKKVEETVDLIKLPDISIYKYYYEGTSFSQISTGKSDIIKNSFTNSHNLKFTKNLPFYFYKINDNLIIKYNSSYDDNNNKLNEMLTSINNTLNINKLKNIVIDLRYNSGGQVNHIRNLEYALLRWEITNPELNIKILTGNASFSAGTMIIDEIKRNFKNVEIIGEYTGGPSTWTTSANRDMIFLGKSKLFIYSSDWMYRYDYNYKDVLHCSNLNKGDGTTWIPDIFIENQIQDYAVGNDKIMNYALRDEGNNSLIDKIKEIFR